METMCYKIADQTRIMADVYCAKGTNRPVVIFIHGGALIWGSREDIQLKIRELLNLNGYTVVSIDYRLAPFTKLPEILIDTIDAIRWVRSGCAGSASINPNRIASFGCSAGAYLALCSGTFADRPNAIVSFYGYGSIIEDWYTKPDSYYLEQGIISESEAMSCLGPAEIISEASFDRFPYYVYTRQNGIWPQMVTGMGVDELQKYCPVLMADHKFPPTLLVHGTKDTDVPCNCSINMKDALKKAGVSVDLHLIKDRNHAFDMDQSDPEVNSIYNKVLNFLSIHL